MRKVLFLVSVIGVSGLRSPNPVGGVTSPRSREVAELRSEVVVLKNKVATLEKKLEDPQIKKALEAKNLREIDTMIKKNGLLIAKYNNRIVLNPTPAEIEGYKEYMASILLTIGVDPQTHYDELGI